MDFKLEFSDITIIETQGFFDDVKKLMDKDLGEDSKWMLSSDVILYHDYGIASFVLHFWNDKKIYIAEYSPSVKDFFSNKDFECLSYWAQQNNWLIPFVAYELAKSNITYWKYFWSVSLVECEYLQELFGNREETNLDIDF